MLAEKKVDLIRRSCRSLDPELRKIAIPKFTIGDALGHTQMILWVRASRSSTRTALPWWISWRYAEIVRWYTDPANHKEVVEIAGRVAKQPPERFGWLYTKNDYYRDRNMLPNLAALQRNLDTTADLGFVKGKVDVSRHADLSIVQEAAQRLK
jgi:NitT/TauT family transport system substrate-binding protein